MNSENTPARIGPNAIIRVAEALNAQGDPQLTQRIFAAARLDHYLDALPEQMVPETDVIALQQTLRQELTPEQAQAINFDAGLRTGDYLLANRIPGFAQVILRLLPPRPACRMLLTAVGKNAWTFSGSGSYRFEMTKPVAVHIADCPISRGATATAPVCAFYTGTFQRLSETLISRSAQVTETQCQALGAEACVFEIRW